MPAETLALVFTALLASGSASPPESAAPDTELLEFLGDFGTSNNEWLDPLSLDDTLENKTALPPDGQQRTEKPHD